MAFDLKKSISLIATFAIIVIIAIGGYYFVNLRKGPYSSSDFVSIDYKWGLGDTLQNSYNSASGNYQYLDNRDSLIKKKVKLRANNVIFIHSKANELDLWKLPDVIANPNADLKNKKVLRYEIVFTYEQKTKKIVFMTDYDEDLKIAQDAQQLQKIVAQTITEAEERYGKY